jgi:hypothetical protein
MAEVFRFNVNTTDVIPKPPVASVSIAYAWGQNWLTGHSNQELGGPRQCRSPLGLRIVDPPSGGREATRIHCGKGET